MSQKDYKKRHIILTIWSWILQLTVWTSFYILMLCKYYENKFSKINNKYESFYDMNGIPLYLSNWEKNKMQKFVLPSLITFIISYVFYIITEFDSSTFKYLFHKKKDNKMYQKMNILFTGKPSIKFNCECYHYETHYETYTDAQGRTQTRTVTVRVNTHYDSFDVPYHSARDVSGPFVLDVEKANLSKKDFVKLQLKLIIEWADAVSLSDYEKYKSDFIEKNRHYDVYMDFDEKRTLPGFNTYNLIMINDNKLCLINKFWYILITFLTFAQFYKWYINSKCIHQSFKIIKLVSTRYNLLEQSEYTQMQPQLNLIAKTYDFELAQTAFCEEKDVDLPTLEEIKEAENKYGCNLINFKKINEVGIDKLNENYNKKVTFSKETKTEATRDTNINDSNNNNNNIDNNNNNNIDNNNNNNIDNNNNNNIDDNNNNNIDNNNNNNIDNINNNNNNNSYNNNNNININIS